MGDLYHGRGYKAYRRRRDALKRSALKRSAKREGLVCGHGSDYGCGQPFDWSLEYPDTMSFSADYPIALKNGGHLTKQDLHPFHPAATAGRVTRQR